jgi:hypothetical protein
MIINGTKNKLNIKIGKNDMKKSKNVLPFSQSVPKMETRKRTT